VSEPTNRDTRSVTRDLPCTHCGRPIDISGPVIGESRDQRHDRAWKGSYIDAVYDLRGGPTQIFHLACYAEARGSAALAALIRG